MIYWFIENLPGLIKDITLTTISVIAGYALSARWSIRYNRETERAEKESLVRNIAFFIGDCRSAIRDARENIAKGLPPYRSIPCSGIEHFQEHLMRYGENDLFVAVSTLRSVIEQVNFLMPTMAQEFVASTTNQHNTASHTAVLKACFGETLKRFSDIEQHSMTLGAKLETKLKELKKINS